MSAARAPPGRRTRLPADHLVSTRGTSRAPLRTAAYLRRRWNAGDMNDPRDHVPAYRTIRVTAPEAPAAVAADTEAWRAHARYPDLRFAGPVFGVAREREEGGWE